MERLIFSSPSSPFLPSKTLPKPPPSIHLPRLDSRNLGFQPPFLADSAPLGWLSSRLEEPASISSSHLRRFSIRCSRRPDVFPGAPAAQFQPSAPLGEVGAQGRSDSRPLFPKVTLHSGVVLLLSAVVGFLIQPFLASSAYASVPNAAKAGGSAAAAVGGKLVRSELLTSAWTGFFAGCLHTLSGPDHLAALAPLSIGRSRLESAAVGALWGCGHDAGQVLFGLLFLLLKDRLHIEVIRTWGTRVVGLTLVIIGGMGIREVSEVPAPCVALENGECDVSMVESLETLPSGKKKIGFATFATGIIHGLQPDALMMVLPALALPSRLAGAAFLGMFLVGTVVAMGSYTVFIGSCSQALKERVPRITEKLTWASSLVAIALGVAIIISQSLGFSLF
ncbi:Chloroplast protein FOR GROWTH AND FERTILITY 2 [Asimina triloba]